MARLPAILLIVSLASASMVAWAVGTHYGAVAGVLAALATVYLSLRALLFLVNRFFKKAVARLVTVGAPQPLEIHLEPRSLAGPELEASTAALERAGSVPVGDFGTLEMPVELRAFVSADASTYAVVYESPKLGRWIDLVSRFAEGRALTTTNAKMAGLMNKPVNKRSERVAGGTVEQLLDRHRAATRRLTSEEGWRIEQLGPDTFVDHFTSAYREEMEFRRQQGGPTRDEVERVAVAEGHELPEEVMAAVTERMRERERERR